MFGYATDESPECMPVTILWAHRLNEKLRELRTGGQFPWALPDSKTQVRSSDAYAGYGYGSASTFITVLRVQKPLSAPLCANNAQSTRVKHPILYEWQLGS